MPYYMHYWILSLPQKMLSKRQHGQLSKKSYSHSLEEVWLWDNPRWVTGCTMFKILAGKTPIYRLYFQWLWNNVAME